MPDLLLELFSEEIPARMQAQAAADLRKLVTGRLVDAGFAERVGLVNTIVGRDRLMPWAFETATAIAANSPSAVQAVRSQISASIADYAKSREALEQELGDRVRASPHFPEGVAAFREKRKPEYR